MKNVLLIHNMPTPYRTELFNRVSMLLSESNINFYLLFQVLTTRRRSYWKNISNEFNFKFAISNILKFESYLLNLRIPLRPFSEIKKFSPSIIITTGFTLHTIFACIYTRQKKIPLIVWIGENQIEGLIKSLRTCIRKLVLKYTAFLFTYGTATQAFYQSEFNFPSSKMINLLNIIPVQHDIDVNEQIRSKKEQLKRKILKLIFVGNLVKNKGIFLLPRLLDCVISSLSGHFIEVTIIGDGPKRKAFLNALSSLKENVRIRFLGNISNDLVLKEISSSHFLLFPTFGDTWGHVITEALSVGTPVLSSRFAGAVPDMLKQNENGFVVDFNNPKYVAEIVSSFADDVSKYNKMCESAKKSYYSAFDSINNAKTMVNVILKVMKN